MNIQSLGEIIEQFQEEVVESGFRRDVKDYTGALSNNQNNIVALREIANKIYDYLTSINDTDLTEKLLLLFPQTPKPFTQGNHYQLVSELLDDKEIPQAQFFQKLQQLINQLNKQLQQNQAKIEEIKGFLAPYIEKDSQIVASKNKAIVSVIFKEEQTISNLKKFTKTIYTWNKILPVYHQILKSDSPTDIEIVEVQNGSIDFVFNFDFHIALNLTELFNEGFKYFLAYVSYKTMSKPISETFFGDKELAKKQKAVEDGMLDNIENAIAEKIKSQHSVAKEKDKKLLSNIDKMVVEVAKLVSSHIINGNDIKLLSMSTNSEEETEEESSNKLKNEIKNISSQVRKALKQLPASEFKKLLERYGNLPDTDENKK